MGISVLSFLSFPWCSEIIVFVVLRQVYSFFGDWEVVFRRSHTKKKWKIEATN